MEDADEWALTCVEGEDGSSSHRQPAGTPKRMVTDPSSREAGAYGYARVKFGSPVKPISSEPVKQEPDTPPEGLIEGKQAPGRSPFRAMAPGRVVQGTGSGEKRYPAVDHIELFRDVLDQPGLEIPPAIQERLERHLEELAAGERWVVEPDVHEALQKGPSEVRRMDAVMQRLEKKWREALEEGSECSPRGSAFDLPTELRRMDSVIKRLQGMWNEALSAHDRDSRESHDSSLDYSGMRSENQSAYWAAGRGTVEARDVARSVEPGLFGCDVLDLIRELGKRREVKADNYRATFEKAIYEHRCRGEVDLSELQSSPSYMSSTSRESNLSQT